MGKKKSPVNDVPSSSSEEEEVPAKKSKQKAEKAGGGAKAVEAPKSDPSKVSSSLASDDMIDLGNKKFVRVNTFKGKQYVDIREFYEKDGKLLPGGKGVSLNMQQWSCFKKVIDDIDSKLG